LAARAWLIVGETKVDFTVIHIDTRYLHGQTVA
jgi:hypothetical protein